MISFSFSLFFSRVLRTVTKTNHNNKNKNVILNEYHDQSTTGSTPINFNAETTAPNRINKYIPFPLLNM